MKRVTPLLLLVSLFSDAAFVLAQKTTIKEYKKVFTTYPFSDPDPIPRFGPLYPYFRFDGYTDKPMQKEWTVVELENDYIKVLILPEIGGKIWTAIEKSTGKPFLYYNQVVKFRDISQRGPWTSGGIEPNYGIIGHTANCATPVDYHVFEHADGSVSCTVGALDLVTRTRWVLDINLPLHQAYFTTNSFWFNQSGVDQPYYTWMNAAISAGEDLELIFPGNQYLGHGGEHSNWSMHPENGKDLAFYKQNDFGSYKSYHVFGKHTEFFGAYYHNDDLGMARYSLRDDKAGKKIWIWGLSRQGMIWDKLLTDTDGQYVEVQSGRLFNQSAESSLYTPFGHRGFAPFQTDTWAEYWMPVRDTDGIAVANSTGALNVVRESVKSAVLISPVTEIRDTLFVYSGSRLLVKKLISAKPMTPVREEVSVTSSEKIKIILGDNRLVYDELNGSRLNRPVDPIENFDWNSIQGLHLQGKSFLHQKNYPMAMERLKACLAKDPYYLSALTDLALLNYKLARYNESLELSRRALQIDTYNPQANYYYGLANLALGRELDAVDGFEIASQSHEFRDAALTQLARLRFSRKDNTSAIHYAQKCLSGNSGNLLALQILALAHAGELQIDAYNAVLERITRFDPLNQFVQFERYKTRNLSRQELSRYFRNELSHESYLELAIFYYSAGLTADALQVLSLSPSTPEVAYWRAFLLDESGQDSGIELKAAEQLNPAFTFPFRPESMKVLNWAWDQTGHWTAAYLKALLFDHFLQPDSARTWIGKAGSPAGFAPFYVYRASHYGEKEKAEEDLKRAASIEPTNWRFGKELINHYLRYKEYIKAHDVARRYYLAHPDDFRLGLLSAKSAIMNGDYQSAAVILDKLKVLPYEGAQESRQYYRESHLMLALDRMRTKKWNQAISEITMARQWPERLGAGKPYPPDIDERVEDWLEYQCRTKMDNREAPRFLDRIIAYKEPAVSYASFARACALERKGDSAGLQYLVAQWKDNEDELSRWLVGALKGQPVELSDPELRPADYRVLRRWLNEFSLNR